MQALQQSSTQLAEQPSLDIPSLVWGVGQDSVTCSVEAEVDLEAPQPTSSYERAPHDHPSQPSGPRGACHIYHFWCQTSRQDRDQGYGPPIYFFVT